MAYDIYTACAIQPEVWVTHKRDDIRRNLNRCLELIDVAPQAAFAAKGSYEAESWAPMKLVTFPEFFIQGHEGTWTFEHYMKEVVIEIPGEETERLSTKAKEHDIFISGCALEYDPTWKDYFFNTQFIIDPTGEIIHKYRKFTTATHYELSVSPHDVLDRYVERYGNGLEAFFPVTDTDIGKIGTLTCMDSHFPETARALGINGAEVIIKPHYVDPMMTPPLEIWQAGNKMRAYENMCYVIAPARGLLLGALRPKCFVPGKSMIVNYNGVVLAYADFPGETMITGVVNLEELRRRRTDPSRNFLSLLRNEVYRKIYEKSMYPPNQFLEESPKTRVARDPREVLRTLFDKGVFKKPTVLPPYLREN